jgi:hypothetical protein
MKLLADPRGVKRKALGYLCALAAAVTLGACAGPQLRPEGAAGTGTIVQAIAGLQVSVEAEAWHGRPGWLTDHVLPFRVQVTNTGAVPAMIQRMDFLLLDDANRQYAPSPPSEVVVLLDGRFSGVGLFPSVGVSGSTAGGTSVGAGLGILLGSSSAASGDIISAALPEGPVQPGAEVHGFLYFPLPASPCQTLRVVFILRQLPGPPRLEFAFRRS